jgi:phospholipase/carboxylesterase
MSVNGPHQGQSVLHVGASLEQAQGAMIMLHGRGATAEDILTLSSELNQPNFAYLAPQALGINGIPIGLSCPLPAMNPIYRRL